MLKKLTDRLMQPNKDGTHSTAYLYKRLFTYIRPYLFRAIIATLITIPIGSLDAAIAFALKPYVDGMQVKQSVQNVSYVPFVIVGFTLLQGLLNYTSVYLNGWLGFRIMCDLRRDLFKKLQTMDVSYFDNTSSGVVIQGYFRDPESLQANVLNNTKQLLTRLFSSLALMAVLISTSWQLSIIAISILLLVLYPSTRIRKIIKNMVRATNNATGDVLSFYTDTVGGIRVVYGYNMPRMRLKKFDDFQKFLFSQAMKTIKAQGWLTPSMHIIASVGIALIIWQGSMMVVKGELTTGAFVSFIAAMLMLYNPIKNLGGAIMTAQMSMLAAGRIFDLLDQQPAIASRPNALTLNGIQKGIVFDQVTFAYVADRPVLRNINLTLNKGETVALVGPSGGGKSTIANLIPRFYDVQEGSIRIDGMDVRDVTLESLRQHVAIVMQDNFLFNGTILENLQVGKPDATTDEMFEALRKAYLLDFVNSLPSGLSTVVGERGVLLSGGQRQRLAIARALLKDSPIVILDEATSALDSQSEVIVQKAMEVLMADRTVIVIAHRLSTIRNADRIVVIEGGEIVESGRHEELLSAGGVYAMLYQTQFSQAEEAQLAADVSVEEAAVLT
jgi:subfamily B ATP-binding cassette protein MsbA